MRPMRLSGLVVFCTAALITARAGAQYQQTTEFPSVQAAMQRLQQEGNKLPPDVRSNLLAKGRQCIELEELDRSGNSAMAREISGYRQQAKPYPPEVRARIIAHNAKLSALYAAFVRDVDAEFKKAISPARAQAQPGADPLSLPSRLPNDKSAPAEKVTAVATTLAKDPKYKAAGDVTHCSEFVRDAAKALGYDFPELAGRAGDQYAQLLKASQESSSKWTALSPDKDPAGVFRTAQDASNAGKPTFVCMNNPNPTPTDSGHCAMIVPLRGADRMQPSGKWGVEVPYAAQAGKPIPAFKNESAFDYLPLSWGFGPERKADIKIFIREKP